MTAGDLLARPRAFGITAVEVDGQDVRAVHAATAERVAAARRGDGPGFVLCNTYRYHGHHVGDVDRRYYRTAEEEADWRERHDPIARLGAWLLDEGAATQDELAAIDADVRTRVDAGLAFALEAAFPDPAAVDEHVYA